MSDIWGDYSKLIKNRRSVRDTILVMLLWLNISRVSCFDDASPDQFLVPGSNPEIRLPERCDGYSINGLRRGVIFSHKHGDQYFPNTNCRVLFSLHKDQQVEFDFEHFQLQKRVGGQCVDFVQFFKVGEVSDQALTEPLCGQSIPSRLAFAHNTSQVALLFRSNHKQQGQGFKLRFERSKSKGCDVQNRHCQIGKRSVDGARKPAATSSSTRSSFSGISPLFLLFPAFVTIIVICVRFS